MFPGYREHIGSFFKEDSSDSGHILFACDAAVLQFVSTWLVIQWELQVWSDYFGKVLGCLLFRIFA